uniref:Uncharacterized protein n=1 Tax=Zosterops lateralis melanops TaxID=1220523 RepID=A0A8D2NXW4_ZOSLA
SNCQNLDNSTSAPAHLEQLPLHLIDHQVRGLPAVAALQVIDHHRVGHLGGVQRPLQPQLLGRQQVGLGVQLHDLLLQLRSPELDVLQPLAQGVLGVLLGSLSAGGLDARIAAVPLGQLVLGGAKAGHGHAAAGAWPLGADHIADFGGQRAGGNDRRLRLLGLRHGGASAAPAPASSPHHSNRGGPAI